MTPSKQQHTALLTVGCEQRAPENASRASRSAAAASSAPVDSKWAELNVLNRQLSALEGRTFSNAADAQWDYKYLAEKLSCLCSDALLDRDALAQAVAQETGLTPRQLAERMNKNAIDHNRMMQQRDEQAAINADLLAAAFARYMTITEVQS